MNGEKGWRFLTWGLLLLAWGLRVAVVTAHRLHPDEALYGYWGMLVLSGRDPWLATVPAYKPPLLSTLLAGSLAFLGRSELAVRWPGLVSGMVAVGLSGRLARQLYRDNLTALVATAAMALSPFALLFSATGFTDAPLVALGLAGCVVALEGHPAWAGLLAGLAVAAKQTGLAWSPLVGLLVVAAGARKSGPRGAAVGLARAAAGFLAVAALMLAWDRIRVAQGAASFWRTGVAGYGGLRMIWPAEWSPRLRAWLGWSRYLLGSLPLDLLLLVGAAGLVARGVRRRDWPALFDLTLIGFSLVYLLIHWLWAFPVWDRYLLPLVVPVSLLLGRVVALAVRKVGAQAHHYGRWVAVGMVVLLLAVGAFSAVSGRVPVGGGRDDYDGIDQVVAFLRQAPEGTVLYHHWLGWEYEFYLFDGPLYLAYWPTPAWLARDVQAFGARGTRYIVFPAWESSARAEAALAAVGYRLRLVMEARNGTGEVRFRLFQVRAQERAEGMAQWSGRVL